MVGLYRLPHLKFPVSGDNDVFLPPGAERVAFTWESHHLFQGRGRGLGEGQSDLPTSAIFSDSSS